MITSVRRVALVRRFVLAVVSGLVAVGGTAVAPRAAVATSGLPDRLGLGVMAAPDATGLDGWVPESGVPWDYAYQYLAGGVNTGAGWQTWNENATFPLRYARRAASVGAIPVFPYYMLQHSHGPCDGCGEAAKDLGNLDDPTTMAAYFADFATLMKRLGPGTHDGVAGYGGLAVVQVEPDLSGFAQQAVLDNAQCHGHCAGQGNDPSLLRAAVARSGLSEVAGYADTYRGFNLALLHLRDRYAPNVRLAFHVSPWAALRDVATDRDPSLDAAGLGATVAAFAARSGVTDAGGATSTYDLLFTDVADRDAGYYEHVLGQDRWWDRDNVAVPNFHRWEAWLGTITDATGRPAFVWQIPVGNQRMLTMNDTDGHYQDNRVEYFLAHPHELVDIGVVGLLFGRGNAGSTSHQDLAGDGITNPAPVCDDHGSSSGPVCTSAAATVADDDGGYLRSAAAAYYRRPVPLPTAACRPSRRLAGADRIATAIAISQDGFPDGARGVVLAAADDFPDALSAAPLAAALDGPVLLVGHDLDPRVRDELARLAPAEIVVVGGSRAVPDAVMAAVGALAPTRRVAGADRFATSAAIARELAPYDEAVVANGRRFPDALAGAPLAARSGAPLVLVDTHAVSGEAAEALDGVTHTIVLGGDRAVGADVLAGLADPVRVAGADRYATAAAVAELALTRGHALDELALATGADFPDALAAGPVIARAGHVLLLADGDATAAAAFVRTHPAVAGVTVLGGVSAVSPGTAAAVACAG